MTRAEELVGQEDEGPRGGGDWGSRGTGGQSQHPAGFGPDVTMMFQVVPDARSTPGTGGNGSAENQQMKRC